MMLENLPLLNQQCTHKCVGNHCPLVGGRVCTAQTFFSCSLGILNIQWELLACTISTNHLRAQEFLHHLIWSNHHLLISFATSVLAEFGRGSRNTARCSRARPGTGVRGRADVRACARFSRARVCADVRTCARARARGLVCVTVCRRCPAGG